MTIATVRQAKQGEPSHAPQRSEEDRALIWRAKELLMIRCAMSEPQAHRSLQHMSMDTAVPMTDIARQIIDALE